MGPGKKRKKGATTTHTYSVCSVCVVRAEGSSARREISRISFLSRRKEVGGGGEGGHRRIHSLLLVKLFCLSISLSPRKKEDGERSTIAGSQEGIIIAAAASEDAAAAVATQRVAKRAESECYFAAKESLGAASSSKLQRERERGPTRRVRQEFNNVLLWPSPGPSSSSSSRPSRTAAAAARPRRRRTPSYNVQFLHGCWLRRRLRHTL